MAQSYRCALIGVGKAESMGNVKGGGHQIAYTHSNALLADDRMELCAGADINPENLAAWRTRFDVAAGYADYHEMLRVEKPDIVSICTYVGLHRVMIEDCARAGVKGVFCEKPFLASPADVRAVREVAAKTRVKITAAHVRRYSVVFELARQWIAQGEIGEPLLISAGLPGWDLSEWGSHWLDMFCFLNGDVAAEWVFGQARVRDFRGYGHAMEEHGVAYVGFKNGCRGVLDGGQALGQPYTMLVTGTEGEIRFCNGENGPYFIHTSRSGWEEVAPPAPQPLWVQNFQKSFNALADWIEGGSEPTIGLSTALATSELNLGAYLSALRGDRVDLPLTDFTVNEWPLEALARKAKTAGGVTKT